MSRVFFTGSVHVMTPSIINTPFILINLIKKSCIASLVEYSSRADVSTLACSSVRIRDALVHSVSSRTSS